MESIGELLRKQREEKSISIKQVAADTNISKRYIEAIESGSFEEFPAEVYLVGFIQNYSEYLGLDGHEVIALYRTHKVSEEPTPIEELVGKKKRHSKGFFLVALLIVMGSLLLGGGLFFFLKPLKKKAERAPSIPIEHREKREFLLSEDLVEMEVGDGDVLLIPIKEGGTFSLTVGVGEEEIQLHSSPETGGIPYTLRQEEELLVPLLSEGDGGNNARFLLQHLLQETGRALLQAQVIIPTPSTPSPESPPPPKKAKLTPPTQPQAPQRKPSRETSSTSEKDSSRLVLLSSASPVSYTLSLLFLGNCFFRYTYDDNPLVERYFLGGDTLQLRIKRVAQIGTSNAGAARLTVAGKEVELGDSGDVVVKKLNWEKDQAGGYHLVIRALR